HRTATITVGDVAQNRRKEKLHQRIDHHQPAAVTGRCRQVFAGDTHDQLRHHRQDDAESDGVNQQGSKYKTENRSVIHSGLLNVLGAATILKRPSLSKPVLSWSQSRLRAPESSGRYW